MPIGLRKLDDSPTPLTDRINRIRAGHGPGHVEPGPTLAEIAAEIGSAFVHVSRLFTQLSQALEREEERLDSEFVALSNGLAEVERRRDGRLS